MDDKENQGVQFQFRKRYRRVDWKLLASVDVDKIARDLDYHALQANIMNIAFCDTKSQDFVDVDDDFIKLYKLGQYTIEYLLHCQEYLSHGTVELESKLREALRFRTEVKEKLEAKQKELTEVKKESRKRKKMIAVYQGMVNTSGVNGFHKCTHCEKAFVSAPFLTSHMERRHGIVASPPANSIGSLDKLRIAHEELEREMEALKKKYTQLQEELQQEKGSNEKLTAMRDTALAQQTLQEEKYERWKKEEESKHAEAIEQIKEVYRKEASEAMEEKRIAQLALVEAKKGIVSNLGALRDGEDDDLRQEHLEEMQSQFEFKLHQLQQEMEQQSRKLRNAEDQHRAALDEARQREERLVKQLQDKTEAERRLHDILESVEIENAKLVQLNKENPDIRATLSPKVLSHLTNDTDQYSGNVEVVQRMLATQAVDVIQPSDKPLIATEKNFTPIADKPYITTYYDHPTEAIDAARKEMENDLALRLLNLAGNQGIESLSNEDYAQFKSAIDRERVHKNTSYEIQKLNSELQDICKRQGPSSPTTRGSPRDSSPRDSPIPTTLPPKSPSFKQSRESLISRPNSSKRSKTTAPASPVLPRAPPAPPAPPVQPPSEKPPSTPDQPPTQPVLAKSPDKQPLQSPSTPELKHDKLTTSTPKVADRYSHFDDDEEDDYSEESEEESTSTRRQPITTQVAATHHVTSSHHVTSPHGGDIRVADMESDVSEEEEEEESLFDDDLEVPASKTPGYSLRDPNYNPLDEESYGDERTPSPVEPVKRRAQKTYSRDMEEADSIFSFDGWSKMKNRNSMSADDAQQNIPMGHVAKMRLAVDNLNKKSTKKTLGISLLPDECPVDGEGGATCPADVEEDDFTVSSLSDRDLSPVGMTVDIKRREEGM